MRLHLHYFLASSSLFVEYSPETCKADRNPERTSMHDNKVSFLSHFFGILIIFFTFFGLLGDIFQDDVLVFIGINILFYSKVLYPQ